MRFSQHFMMFYYTAEKDGAHHTHAKISGYKNPSEEGAKSLSERIKWPGYGLYCRYETKDEINLFPFDAGITSRVGAGFLRNEEFASSHARG